MLSTMIIVNGKFVRAGRIPAVRRFVIEFPMKTISFDRMQWIRRHWTTTQQNIVQQHLAWLLTTQMDVDI